MIATTNLQPIKIKPLEVMEQFFISNATGQSPGIRTSSAFFPLQSVQVQVTDCIMFVGIRDPSSYFSNRATISVTGSRLIGIEV
jgi:hypothetical protein